MKSITFLALHLLAVLFMLNNYAEARFLAVLFMVHSYAEALVCTGCVQEADPNKPEIKEELAAVLTSQNGDFELIRVTKAQTQIVAGVKYIVDFEVKDRSTNSVKTCHTSFVSQPWLHKRIVQDFSCN